MLPRPKMPGGHALTPSPRAARAEDRRRRGQGNPGPPHRRAAPGSSSDAGGSCAGCCWSHVHPAVPCSTLCPSPRLHTLPEPAAQNPPRAPGVRNSTFLPAGTVPLPLGQADATPASGVWAAGCWGTGPGSRARGDTIRPGLSTWEYA